MGGPELTDSSAGGGDDARAPTHRARVLIADPRPIVTSGLAAALAETVDFVAHASCHEAARLPEVLGCSGSLDAIVIDTGMFEGGASDAIDAARRLDPDVAVLALMTVVDGPLLEALSHDDVSCASSYSTAQEIVSALRALLNGQTLLPPAVQQALTSMLRHPGSLPSPLLTPREKQVLELAATGLTILEIAATLHISRSTAKTHLLRVYAKLNAPNRSAAVATALARGVLRLSPVPAGA